MTKHRFTKVFYSLLFILITACSPLFLQKDKDIVYDSGSKTINSTNQTLNIFSSKDYKNQPVILFAYGGSWNSGHKELYNFLGKRLARKGYVAVIIDYPLAPEYKIQEMSLSVAQAIHWTYEHIEAYGGNKDAIFVSGHSAGGHLVALNTVNNMYFEALEVENPIKGAILIDAAGLDMYTFLKHEKLAAGASYLQAFTNNPETWKKHSPIYFLSQDDPSLLILMGGKTYPGIKASTNRLLKKADSLNIEPTFHLQPKKRHAAMITQFFLPWSKPYKWINEFIVNLPNSKQ